MFKLAPHAVASGLVLPGDTPLEMKEVKPGLFVVQNAYSYDYGFFGRLPLYAKPAEDAKGDAPAPRL